MAPKSKNANKMSAIVVPSMIVVVVVVVNLYYNSQANRKVQALNE